MTSDVAQQTGGSTALRPFLVNVSEADVNNLRARINATRWPERETVTDTSQGVRLEDLQEVARHWGSGYDWRSRQTKLNTLPQFLTEIDGLDIHFIHVRSKHQNAMPIIITHGWPGSIIEQLRIIAPLTDPTAYGGAAADAFHVVIPSIPGYGFSGRPSTTYWDPDHIARAWVTLMTRLGYKKFVAQGGDFGALITNVLALRAPPELLGIHTNLAFIVPPDLAKMIRCGDPPPSTLSAEEKRTYEQIQVFVAKGFAYGLEQATRPQTLYGLADSPVGLAAWLLDHGDGWGQPAPPIMSALLGHPVDGHTTDGLTRDDVLDNITVYWFTTTGVSAARSYWQNAQWAPTSHVSLPVAINASTPAAVSVFPGELYTPPRSWTEQAYHKLIYFNNVAAGGHFAAWEQPQLFAEELRNGLRTLRQPSYS